MLRYLRLFNLFVRTSIQTDAAYRLDFLLQFPAAIVHVGGLLLGLWVIFHNTADLNGWGAYHMLVIIGVFRVVNGLIAIIIAPNMRRIMEDVRSGNLDFTMLKPINTQFLASTQRVQIWRISDPLAGGVLALVGVHGLAGTVPIAAIFLFLAMLAAGAIIIYSFWLILATLSFWLVRVQNLEMIFWNVFEAGRYPVSIYGPPVRFVLTFVFPVAFAVNFPAQALAGGLAPGVPGVPLEAWIGAVLVAPGMFLAATAFWRYGIRHYSGASA